MAVDVTTEVVIRRAPSQVATFAADPDNVPAWYTNIKSVEWVTPRPMVVGSRLAFVAHFLGRRMAYTYEVIEYRPGERLVMRTSEGPFPMETTYTWHPTGSEDTLMRLSNRGEPAGFSRLAAPFMTMAVRNANRKDLARLKELLESS